MVQGKVRETHQDAATSFAEPPSDYPTDEPFGERASPPETGRKLRRGRDDHVVAGVCSGLGAYLGIDPVLLRIAFVVLAIGGGSGVLLYILGWVLIPEAAEGERLGLARPADRVTGAVIVGGALILLGAMLVMRRVLPWFDDRIIWPLVLIGIGLLVAQRGMKR